MKNDSCTTNGITIKNSAISTSWKRIWKSDVRTYKGTLTNMHVST